MTGIMLYSIMLYSDRKQSIVYYSTRASQDRQALFFICLNQSAPRKEKRAPRAGRRSQDFKIFRSRQASQRIRKERPTTRQNYICFRVLDRSELDHGAGSAIFYRIQTNIFIQFRYKAGRVPAAQGHGNQSAASAQKNTRDRPRSVFRDQETQENGERAATMGEYSNIRVKGSRRPATVFFCYAAGIHPGEAGERHTGPRRAGSCSAEISGAGTGPAAGSNPEGRSPGAAGGPFIR